MSTCVVNPHHSPEPWAEPEISAPGLPTMDIPTLFEQLAGDILEAHGRMPLTYFPRSFSAIREYFRTMGEKRNRKQWGDPIKGAVWHHPDGRMVKIKAADFGIERPR